MKFEYGEQGQPTLDGKPVRYLFDRTGLAWNADLFRVLGGSDSFQGIVVVFEEIDGVVTQASVEISDDGDTDRYKYRGEKAQELYQKAVKAGLRTDVGYPAHVYYHSMQKGDRYVDEDYARAVGL